MWCPCVFQGMPEVPWGGRCWGKSRGCNGLGIPLESPRVPAAASFPTHLHPNHGRCVILGVSRCYDADIFCPHFNRWKFGSVVRAIKIEEEVGGTSSTRGEIQLAQDRTPVADCCEHGDDPSAGTKAGISWVLTFQGRLFRGEHFWDWYYAEYINFSLIRYPIQVILEVRLTER